MIYLDSAATTLQKPPEVAMAAARAIRQLASPGRGGHRPAMEAAKVAFSCREEAAALLEEQGLLHLKDEIAGSLPYGLQRGRARRPEHEALSVDIEKTRQRGVSGIRQPTQEP